MSRPTRDGTAEHVSLDQILRHERGQGNNNFPCLADHEQDGQPSPVGLQTMIYVMAIHYSPCMYTKTKTYVLESTDTSLG